MSETMAQYPDERKIRRQLHGGESEQPDPAEYEDRPEVEEEEDE